MTDKTGTHSLEFSRRVKLGELESGSLSIHLVASAAERAALARRFDICAIDRLEADLKVKWIAGGPYVRVTGRLAADVVQECVVSLEPVHASVDEVVTQRFGPPQLAEAEVEVGLDEEDPPEAIVDGEIEVGEQLAQQLALALDPYPRLPDAQAEVAEGSAESRELPRNPFAALSNLRLRGK